MCLYNFKDSHRPYLYKRGRKQYFMRNYKAIYVYDLDPYQILYAWLHYSSLSNRKLNIGFMYAPFYRFIFYKEIYGDKACIFFEDVKS
jgi:hypothetical protein